MEGAGSKSLLDNWGETLSQIEGFLTDDSNEFCQLHRIAHDLLVTSLDALARLDALTSLDVEVCTIGEDDSAEYECQWNWRLKQGDQRSHVIMEYREKTSPKETNDE